MERLIDGERRLRREYSAAFKASVLARTREPGASVAGVALSHGLHPNMVCVFRTNVTGDFGIVTEDSGPS